MISQEVSSATVTEDKKEYGVFRKREALLYGISSIFPIILGLLALPLYSRWFSPEVYGSYSLLESGATFFSSIVLALFSNSLYRYYFLDQQNNQLDKLISTIYISVIFILISLNFVIILISLFVDSKFIMYGMFLATVNILYALIAQNNRIEHNAISYTLIKLFDPIWRLLIPLGLLALGMTGYNTLLITAISAWGFATLIGVIWIRNILYNIRLKRFDFGKLKVILKYGTPLMIFSLLNWVMNISNRYQIKWIMNDESAGIYTMGYNAIWMPITLISGVIILIIGPVFWEKVSVNGLEDAYELIKKSCGYYFALGIPACIGLMVMKSEIVNLVFGKEYWLSHSIFVPLSIGAFFAGLQSFFIKPWEVKQDTKVIMLFLLVGAIINILLNFTFIPLWGIKGAAYSTLLSYSTMLISLQIYTRIKMKISIFPSKTQLLSTFVSCLSLGITLIIGKSILDNSLIGLITIVLLAAVVYFLTFKLSIMQFERRIKR